MDLKIYSLAYGFLFFVISISVPTVFLIKKPPNGLDVPLFSVQEGDLVRAHELHLRDLQLLEHVPHPHALHVSLREEQHTFTMFFWNIDQ
jgi:hypothetical protein